MANSFAAWQNFYVIVGSAAAALTGLQFVVIALINDVVRDRPRTDIDAFGTPTILHFSAALLVSAINSAPWPTMTSAATALGVAGAGGVGYMLIVWRRARHASYRPVLEDWVWHVALPFAGYLTLLVSSVVLATAPSRPPMFAVGACALLWVFVGIHNAWDVVTYVVVDRGFETRADRADANRDGHS